MHDGRRARTTCTDGPYRDRKRYRYKVDLNKINYCRYFVLLGPLWTRGPVPVPDPTDQVCSSLKGQGVVRRRVVFNTGSLQRRAMSGSVSAVAARAVAGTGRVQLRSGNGNSGKPVASSAPEGSARNKPSSKRKFTGNAIILQSRESVCSRFLFRYLKISLST